MCSIEKRIAAWKRLEADLDRQKLAAMTSEIPLEAVLETAPSIVGGGVRGRIVVNIG
jgi:acrylyl-CoA reductase (NADPH)